MDSRRPAAQVDIDEALARRLLREQVPDMATQPLSIVDEGWDNVTIRVGA